MTSGFPEEIAPIRLDLPTFGAPAKTANGFSVSTLGRLRNTDLAEIRKLRLIMKNLKINWM